MLRYDGKCTTAIVYTNNIDKNCEDQIIDITNNPAFTNPIKIMPDTHAGEGTVIGFTMKLGKELSPNTVGVDVGCGVSAVNIGKGLFPGI